MTIIFNPFLREILKTHELLINNVAYPFFDSACRQYEAIRAGMVDKNPLSEVFEKYGLTEYHYRKALTAFRKGGVNGYHTPRLWL